NPAELFECISQCILNAVDRDCLAGWGARVYLIYKPCTIGALVPAAAVSITRKRECGTYSEALEAKEAYFRIGVRLLSKVYVDYSLAVFSLRACTDSHADCYQCNERGVRGFFSVICTHIFEKRSPLISKMTSVTRKRNRPEDWGDLEPSPVIHISELPEHTLEIFLLRTFEQYGPIKDVTMMPQRGQALIEFADISSAESAVVRCSEIPLTIANHRVRVNYSTSKRIVQRQLGGESGRDYSDGPLESRVLLFTIYNAQYPITVDVIHQITSRHGRVLRIVIFRKTHVQAMVEFKNTDDARNAKRNLNGADIYSGCCTLKIEFARPARLTVLKNDQETWDYENSLLPTDPARIRISDGRANVSLLGRFGRSHDRHEAGSRSQNGDGAGYSFHDSFARHSGALSLGAPGSTLFDQLALSVHPSLAAAAAAETVLHGRSATPVVMVYNMDMDKMNCDRLFNLLCLYGNVIRVKFLRSKEGSAMAQMGDTLSVDRVIRNLSDVPLLGNQLQIRPSKQLVIVDVPKPFDLPDGTPSFKDYTGCRENRYINPEKASKNRIYPPSNTLHYWNCPPDFSANELCQIFVDCDAKPPSRIAEFPTASERSSSGLIEWNSVADAVAALAFTNHYSIPYPKGRFPFIMKLSFSNAPVQDRSYPGSRKSNNYDMKKPISSSSESSYPEQREQQQKTPTRHSLQTTNDISHYKRTRSSRLQSSPDAINHATIDNQPVNHICPTHNPTFRSQPVARGYNPQHREIKKNINRSAVTPFRCLAAMPPEGSTRAEILPGCPSLDRGSREAEVGFEPRTLWSANSRSNHLRHLARGVWCSGHSGLPLRAHRTTSRSRSIEIWLKWLERERTDRKVRGSNPTRSASRLPLSRLGQPGSIPALVLPSGGMAARHRKSATAERYTAILTGACCHVPASRNTFSPSSSSSLRSPPDLLYRLSTVTGLEKVLMCEEYKNGRIEGPPSRLIAQRLERERTDRKVRGSNPTRSASRLPLSRLGQPGSIPALVLPSGGMAARQAGRGGAERTDRQAAVTQCNGPAVLFAFLDLLAKKNCSAVAPFRCLTAMPHEGWDTARLPKPRQGKSRGRAGRVRTTDLPVSRFAL
ncbi:Heteroproteinous nuclear ribonucleoprotein L, partial [Clonorchis sinensis]